MNQINNSLEGTEIFFYRKVLRITWRENVNNDELLETKEKIIYVILDTTPGREFKFLGSQ